MDIKIQPSSTGYQITCGPAHWTRDGYWSLESEKAKSYPTFREAHREMTRLERSDFRGKVITFKATQAAYAIVGRGMLPEDKLFNDATVLALSEAYPNWKALRSGESDSLAKGFRQFVLDDNEPANESELVASAHEFVGQVKGAYEMLSHKVTTAEALVLLAKAVAEFASPVCSRLWDRMLDLGMLQSTSTNSLHRLVMKGSLAEARKQFESSNRLTAKSQLEFASTLNA